MSENQILEIVFGSMLGIFSIVLILLAFLLFYKHLTMKKKCTENTKGEVIGYSIERVGDAIHLPIVEYFVNNIRYKVTGPKFRGSITTTKRTPADKNDIAYWVDDKYVLHINQTANTYASIHINPLAEMYPIGKKVDVYYAADNPKLAYVERYVSQAFWFWFMFIIGLACAIGAVLVMVLL